MSTWQEAFVATGLALGDDLEDATTPLGAAGAREAEPFLQAMRAPTRARRAESLARAITAIAVDLERMRLA